MEDLRVQRTYLLLKNALLELLAKKSFDEIKVNDICNLAMIHRTTFYSHFQDKYDLLEYCIKNIEQELTEKINTTQYSNSKEFYTNFSCFPSSLWNVNVFKNFFARSVFVL